MKVPSESKNVKDLEMRASNVTDAPRCEEVVTRQYQEGDDEEIVALLKSAFDIWAKMPNPLEYWRWKYLQTPLKTHIAVSTVGGRIAGVGHTIKMNVKLGNRVLVSYLDDDFATYAAYRKKGIYKAIQFYLDNRKSENCADFCYWITKNPVVLTKVILHEQLSFTTPFSALIRVRDIDRFIEKIPVGGDFSSMRSSYQLHNIPTYSIEDNVANSGFDLLDVDSFDERFETFWSGVANEYDYIMMRDRDYMNWRFTLNPLQEYITKAVLSEGKVIGYTILEIDDSEGYNIGYICDLLPARGRDDVVLLLFKEAVKYFDSLNVDCIYLLTMQGHLYQKIASSLGFINAPVSNEYYLRFWGYNDNFYNTIRSLTPDKIYFSYSDIFDEH
jgi:hypothetical protein